MGGWVDFLMCGFFDGWMCGWNIVNHIMKYFLINMLFLISHEVSSQISSDSLNLKIYNVGKHHIKEIK